MIYSLLGIFEESVMMMMGETFEAGMEIRVMANT